jgi:hypothetical protein
MVGVTETAWLSALALGFGAIGLGLVAPSRGALQLEQRRRFRSGCRRSLTGALRDPAPG